jgi:hypothetical protein
MTTFRLHAIRLVNFHNFIDEMVEIRDGGHLFLLGDNGSGKTTVLDAIHYVMAGGELELNAAARLGGRRDGGRTLQGLVLRYDLERGVRNEGGAVAYAAVELVGEGGERLSLGVGTEATTLDAKVTRWGFVVRRPLAEVAFLDDAERPLGREALRRQLGSNHVFAQLAGYRKEIARRLFGSERQYEEVVRFWGMAKAYREIVASARDFGALFERLLPSPDGAVFDEILRTLRAIDDLELALRDLDGQADYVRGLVELAREVASHREAAARYRWLAVVREREAATATRERELREAERLAEVAGGLDAEAEAARLASERADESLRRAERDESAGLLLAVRDGEARRDEVANDRERAAHAAREAKGERESVARVVIDRRRELRSSATDAARSVDAAARGLAELPGDLASLGKLGSALGAIAAAASGEGSRELPPVISFQADLGASRDVVDALTIEARDRLIAAGVVSRSARVARETAAASVAELEDSREGVIVPGLERARRALADERIAARPLYELLEPADGADAAELAAIEALATADALAALVVPPADVDAARRIVAAVAPEIRVVVAAAVDLPLPPWCERALASCSPETRVARDVLAALLHQPDALGEVSPLRDDGALALRGLGFQLVARAPRWLGAEARRRAGAEQLAAAREQLVAATAIESDATRTVRAAEALVSLVEDLVRAVDAAGSTVVGAWHAASAAAQRLELANRMYDNAERRRLELDTRLAVVEVDLAALRGRIDGVDLDELERRLASLRVARDRGHARWKTALAAQADAVASASAARRRAAEAAAVTVSLDDRLVDAARALRDRLAAIGSVVASAVAAADDDELAHYVRITQRGDSFRSLESICQRIVEVERAADIAAAELDNDGSRGVRSLSHATRFGFNYSSDRNEIVDRRGQPIAGVLAELERSIAEQRTVVNDRTRMLMDSLVMGELARHLQAQVHSLHDMIKGINRVLRDLRFGPSSYRFEVTPRTDRAELIDLVRRLSILDEDSRSKFRAWIDAHLDELRAADEGEAPALLDYRRWFEFKLRASTTNAEGVELTRALRAVGSGGEQGVPNYLLVLALAKLMFDAAGAAVRPLLFDEAFYGIDAGRRDQLLRLATELGLQLFVASPDQDGATPAVRTATTLFVVKDANHDVHLAPYHYWNHTAEAQTGLFDAPGADPDAAACRIDQP